MADTSNTLLLSTKLKIPAPRKNYVVRRALFDKLSECTDMSIIFVRGGAGTGKTTLLSSFIREEDLKNVCWLSLDDSNTNVYSFWLYFTTAVSAFFNDDSFLSLMQSNMDASHMENLLVLLINRLCGEEDYYMVLDDLHCIHDAALIRTFEFFIESMPSNFHFFMLSRDDPPVYLGPLAVSGRLLYIDGSQMQLTQDESMAFLHNTMKLNASDKELGKLVAFAEGWIGGLQLAAAAGTVGYDYSKLLRVGGGIAAEYLNREILEALSQEERDFLIKTGFLSYFDADICSKLFYKGSKPEFESMIDHLVQKNLFIICMDEQNGIYRYHNLLSEYLVQQFRRLPQEQIKQLYVKAAGIFEQRDDFEEALREYSAAGDYKEVLRVAKAVGGRIEAWSYLDQVPMELLIADAELTLQCFMYNFGNLNIDRCKVIFNKVKEHYGDSDIFNIIQFAEAYVSDRDGIIPKFNTLTAEQIDLLHFGPVAKAMILVQNSLALVEQMQYEEAEKSIKKALQENAGANIFVDFYAYNQLAQVYEEQGRLNDSLSCYAKSEEMFKSPSVMKGIGVNFYFGIAGIYLKRMELEQAAHILEQGRLLLEEQRDHVDITYLTLDFHMAEMKLLSGDFDAGATFVNEILKVYPKYSVLTMARLIYELNCVEKLSPDLAEDFLKELGATEEYKYQPFMRLIRARILFKRNDIKEAMKETDDILMFSRLHVNKLHLVGAGLLKIYMLIKQNDKSGGQREINNLLLEAIHYAQEDRILMPFYLERSVILPLLCELSKQTSAKSMSASDAAFIRDIIAICDDPVLTKAEQSLLSARELEVLGELSLGLTNKEIADKLCISMATVKTHVLSIFSKLGVSSRMMAVDKGRREGLV